MTDLAIIISERTAQRVNSLLNTIDAHLELSVTERDTVDLLRYAIQEARNAKEVKERLQTTEQTQK